MIRTRYAGLVSGPALLTSVLSHADSVHQNPNEFIVDSFGNQSPELKVLRLNEQIRYEARTMAGCDLNPLGMPYWQRGIRTAWILDHTDEELPVTTGIVIDSGAIESVRALVFDNHRGWEVHYPFSRVRFTDAKISVSALKRQAELALLLSMYTG